MRVWSRVTISYQLRPLLTPAHRWHSPFKRRLSPDVRLVSPRLVSGILLAAPPHKFSEQLVVAARGRGPQAMQRKISNAGWSNFGRRVSCSRAPPHFSHAGSGFGTSTADASSALVRSSRAPRNARENAWARLWRALRAGSGKDGGREWAFPGRRCEPPRNTKTRRVALGTATGPFGVPHFFAKQPQRKKPSGTCLRGPRGRSGRLSDQNGFQVGLSVNLR
jgi:hypothetical protein